MTALLLEALLIWLGLWLVAALGLRRIAGSAARGRDATRILVVATGFVSAVPALLYLPLRYLLVGA